MSNFPKQADQIVIKVTIQQMDNGNPDGEPVQKEMPLHRKILEYLMQLGYNSAHVYNLIATLLTKGKLRIEFRNYTERLELTDPDDKLEKAQAMALIDDFLEKNKAQDSDFDRTQRIVIQAPKRN